MEYVLQTSDLTKVFKKKAAVSGINLNVMRGDIYGFIGRNGAGKTTFIRMVSGLANPTKGEIKLFEREDLDVQRRKTGTMIENPAVFPDFTATQNLQYYCRMLGVNPDPTINDMMTMVGLQDAGMKKAKNFSLGMKQRLAIAITLLGDPEFLLLDEPINGLDPTGIKEIRELILKLNKERQITILISSHILGELSKIATRYGVINDGRLVDEFGSKDLEGRCETKLELQVDKAQEAVEVLHRILGIEGCQIIDENTVHIGQQTERAGQINTVLATNGIIVNSSRIIGQDLEEYFIQLMDKTSHINR